MSLLSLPIVVVVVVVIVAVIVVVRLLSDDADEKEMEEGSWSRGRPRPPSTFVDDNEDGDVNGKESKARESLGPTCWKKRGVTGMQPTRMPMANSASDQRPKWARCRDVSVDMAMCQMARVRMMDMRQALYRIVEMEMG